MSPPVHEYDLIYYTATTRAGPLTKTCTELRQRKTAKTNHAKQPYYTATTRAGQLSKTTTNSKNQSPEATLSTQALHE